MNTQELADAMCTLANSCELRERMGENGYRRVNAYYRTDQMRERFHRLYMDIYQEMDE